MSELYCAQCTHMSVFCVQICLKSFVFYFAWQSIFTFIIFGWDSQHSNGLKFLPLVAEATSVCKSFCVYASPIFCLIYLVSTLKLGIYFRYLTSSLYFSFSRFLFCTWWVLWVLFCTLGELSLVLSICGYGGFHFAHSTSVPR